MKLTVLDSPASCTRSKIKNALCSLASKRAEGQGPLKGQEPNIVLDLCGQSASAHIQLIQWEITHQDAHSHSNHWGNCTLDPTVSCCQFKVASQGGLTPRTHGMVRSPILNLVLQNARAQRRQRIGQRLFPAPYQLPSHEETTRGVWDTTPQGVQCPLLSDNHQQTSHTAGRGDLPQKWPNRHHQCRPQPKTCQSIAPPRTRVSTRTIIRFEP